MVWLRRLIAYKCPARATYTAVVLHASARMQFPELGLSKGYT